MTARGIVTLLAGAAVCVVALAGTAQAQSAGDEPTPELRLRGYLRDLGDPSKDAGAPPTEAERSQEAARRSQERARRSGEEAPRSPTGPGYIAPLSTETSTGRMGVAGWTSPAVDPPGGPSIPEYKAGQFGFGFAIEWGAPSRPPAEAP